MIGGGLVAVGAFLFLFAAGALLIGGGIWFAIRQSRKEQARRSALAASVLARGYQYMAEVPSRAQLFAQSPFGLGNNRKALDVVWGLAYGHAFETFAYRYETQSTDSHGRTTTHVHRYQVTWVPLPAPLPAMRLTADNALLRLFAKMGAKDLKVESHDFNQRWKVWSADERTAHAVLTPALIDFLLAPGWEGRGIIVENSVLMTFSQGYSDLSDVEGVVSGLLGFIQRMPRFLREP